jgi:hypothetical protein
MAETWEETEPQEEKPVLEAKICGPLYPLLEFRDRFHHQLLCTCIFSTNK